MVGGEGRYDDRVSYCRYGDVTDAHGVAPRPRIIAFGRGDVNNKPDPRIAGADRPRPDGLAPSELHRLSFAAKPGRGSMAEAVARTIMWSTSSATGW